MEPTRDNNPFAFPPSLLAKVEAAAVEDDRPALNVVQDAVERYMEDRAWNKLFAFGEARAKALGLTEADVPRLLAEYRQEKRQGHE